LLASATKQDGISPDSLLDRAAAGQVTDVQGYFLQKVDGRVSDSPRRILTSASILRTGFSLDDVRAVCHKRVHEVDILALAKEHLLLADGERYFLHDLVRTFFHGMLETPREFHETAA
jgi:hypothetical protein